MAIQAGPVTADFLLLRGSADLLEESGGNLSPAGSVSSIPTCMPFSWFGDKDKEREDDLPYIPVESGSELSQDRKNKVNNAALIRVLPSNGH